MTATEESVREEPESSDAPAPGRRELPRWTFDLAVIAVYVAVTVALTWRMWLHPRSSTVAANRQDQTFFEFVLARAARAVTHHENPLFTTAMNTPHGVNLMANTSVLGMTIPLTPVTLALGPSVAFVVMTTIAFAGTATAWYLVLSRHLVQSRPAAALGGLFCAFAPGMMSQANGHPNLLGQFLVPVIVWRVASLPASRHLIRDGVILGLLVTYQMFINEEILFLTALALVVCAVVWLLSRPRTALAQWRPYLVGLGVAGGVAAVLLAYPLWFQFFGPESYVGIPPNVAQGFGMDAASYLAFPPRSLVAGSSGAAKLAVNATERNSFFGWPLAVLLVVIIVWQWRRLSVRMVGVVLLFFVALSLGSQVLWHGEPTGVTGPWRWLVSAPLFDSVVPARFALGATAAAGVLLALGLDALLRPGSGRPWSGRQGQVLRGVGVALIVAALVPLVPHWIDTRAERPTPRFFTEGTWRGYLPAGTSVLVGNTGRFGEIDGMRWTAATGLEFPVTRGYFLGPNPNSPERVARFGSMPTFTSGLLGGVVATGKVPVLNEKHRTQARLDLAAGHTGLIVVPVGSAYENALHRVLNDLMGENGVLVKDVWVWRVH